MDIDNIKSFINKIRFSIQRFFKKMFNSDETEPLLYQEDIDMGSGKLLLVEEDDEEISYRYSL